MKRKRKRRCEKCPLPNRRKRESVSEDRNFERYMAKKVRSNSFARRSLYTRLINWSIDLLVVNPTHLPFFCPPFEGRMTGVFVRLCPSVESWSVLGEKKKKDSSCGSDSRSCAAFRTFVNARRLIQRCFGLPPRWFYLCSGLHVIRWRPRSISVIKCPVKSEAQIHVGDVRGRGRGRC